MKKSIEIFGEQKKLTVPTCWNIFVRNLDFEIEWILLNLNSLFFAKSISNYVVIFRFVVLAYYVWSLCFWDCHYSCYFFS